MAKLILIMNLLAMVASCTSRKNNYDKCWNEERVEFVKGKLLAVIETSSDEKVEPELIEKNCQKQKYSIKDRFLIISQKSDGVVSGKTLRTSENPRQCLERALNKVKAFSSSVDDRIVNLHQQKFQEEWKDIDLSPVGWLNCNSDEITFNDSVTIFLHELTHDLRDDNKSCLYLAISRKHLCFNFPESLPLRSYGKQTTFPTKNANAAKGLAMIQQVYLTDTDQPFIKLLDELNAYALTNFNYIEMLKQDGAKKLFDTNGKRAGILLPLFYKISVDYLQRLKKENNELFQNAILENKTNREGLKELFQVVRITYQAWKKELERVNESEKDWEKLLFLEAEAIHERLGL